MSKPRWSQPACCPPRSARSPASPTTMAAVSAAHPTTTLPGRKRALPRQCAYIVGEDEILEVAWTAELHPRHDIVQPQPELLEAGLAEQHHGPAPDQVGDKFARDLLHGRFLLLLAATQRKLDRIEIEKHGDGMPDLHHRLGEFEPHSAAPAVGRGT